MVFRQQARPLQWQSFACSIQGHDRDVNEDAHLMNPEAGLFVVSDGMGGHSDGWLASRLLAELLQRTIDPELPFDRRLAHTNAALHAANSVLFEEGQARRPPSVVGATVVACLVDAAALTLIWAGDSRAYLWRSSQLTQLTTDHTVAVEISPDARNPQALTRAVGAAPTCAFDRRDIGLSDGDQILICTDGLTKAIADSELAELFRLRPPVDAEWLIARALSNGARDDVTAVLLRFRAARHGS